MIGFGELYDDDTVAAIDSRARVRGERPGGRRTVAGWRGGTVAAAVLAGGLAGARDALEDEPEPAVQTAPAVSASAAAGLVTVLFVPGDPRGTVAVIRPWLASIPGAVTPAP